MPRHPVAQFALPLLLIVALRGPAAAGVPASAEPAAATAGPDRAAPDAAPGPELDTLRTAAPKLPLAEVYEPGVDLDRYLVSEKFDGVRAFWDGRRLVTRGGLVIQAPAWFTAGFPAVPLDGELWMGRGTFAETSGTVRTLQPDSAAWQRMRYVVFDLPAADGGFERRWEALVALVRQAPSARLRLAEQASIGDRTALEARLEQIVAAGGEGLMLHRRDAPYRAGRSDDLLKVKPYLEGEARVLAHLPGAGKYAGMLGSLRVEEPDGTRFKLGTGFTDAERADPPPVGSLVTFKYHGRTKFGRPRFASFLRVADEL